MMEIKYRNIKYRNTNPDFGDTETLYSGPMESLVAETHQTLREWAVEARVDGETVEQATERLEDEFVSGLVEVEEPEGAKVGPGWKP